MGVIISAIAVATKSLKKTRDKKKAEKVRKAYGPQGSQRLSESQTQDPAVLDAQQGLTDEHSASVPPPELGTGPRAEFEGAGLTAVERNVALEAPVPLATATEATKSDAQPTTSAKTANKDTEMASDEDYAAFLDKANEDPNAGGSKTQSSGKIQLKAVDHGAEVPAVLKKVTKDAFYVSDADEPFEPVCLKLGKGKGLPDEETFAKLVGHPNPKDAEVSIMDVAEWDSRGQYKEVVDATREATKGSDVRVYSISHGGSRTEYWVVGVEGGKLLGVKALAIES